MELNAKLLHKMAIDNSDGIIFMTDEPDADLLAAAEAKGIPHLKKEDAEGNLEAYIDFYDKLSDK